MNNISIVWVTAELTPYVKVGGLADVSSALPKALDQLGHDVRVIMPYYGVIEDENIKSTGLIFPDPEGLSCEIYTTEHKESGLRVYLLKHPSFIGEPYDENDDLGEKFSTFNWLVSRVFDQLQWYPSIIHANDWHTGLLPYIVRDTPAKTIYTLHNLAFQGVESKKHLQRLQIDTSDLDIPEDTINFMQIGINFSDKVTTVSQTYAIEIQTPEFGFGLENNLSNHPAGVTGIVHGIDVDEYSPETDHHIFKNYDIDTLETKMENKIGLQEKAGLPPKKDIFLLGLVSRLFDQKGVHLLIEIIPELFQKGIQIIVLGTGDENYERELQRLEYSFPEYFKFFNLYNVQLSHQIFAGVDAFLVPSKFEPCGLTQLYAMAYGTIPIVRHTGGLADTVHEGGKDAEGFVFHEFKAEHLKNAILRAADLFNNDQKKWRQLQHYGMSKDLSWSEPAEKWVKLYNSLLED